ncbi:mite group 2 allergen-like Ixo r 2 [Haemaphysalis longicornis]
MLTLLALFVAFAFACSERVGTYEYEDCGSTAKILSIKVEPCPSDPCVFLRGKDTKIHFSVIADQDSKGLRLEPTMNVLGLKLPVPGIERDLCKEAYPCPIVKGRRYDGTMTVRVPTYAPPFAMNVEMKMIGDKGMSTCTKASMLIQ